MAELNLSQSGGFKKRAGSRRSKKLSTRVDLTPMVDLGFLLITFFIFTTSMSRPKSMSLILPKDSPNPVELKESTVLTLIPSGNNQLCYYEGSDPSKIKSGSMSSLRKIILDKKRLVYPMVMTVLIKPSATCNYKNTIAILDEMMINKVRWYALLDLSGTEKDLLANLEN